MLAPKKDWEEKLLGEVISVFRGGSPRPIQNFITNESNGLNWIKIGDTSPKGKYIKDTREKIIPEGEKYSRRVNVGDFLLSNSMSFGRPYILKTEGCIHDGWLVLQNYDLHFESEFLYYLLTSKLVIDQYKSKASGSGVLNLNKELVKNVSLQYPKISEQTRIATILSDMDSEIEALEQKLAKARQIKQGMMQELLTGRIRLIETVKTEKPKAKKGHNEHINDAVLIGTMAACFGSDNFPMTRFKYTKVSYLLKRYKEEQDTGYLKKAAGPYKPQTRYGGAEKIALQNKYVVSRQATYKGTAYEGFVSGEDVNEAIAYFKEWYGEEALQWINKFKFEKNDNLELWATVDMAIQDLKKEGKLANVATVKQIIKENKEWKDKLKRPAFSDDNIHNAIIKMDTLFS